MDERGRNFECLAHSTCVSATEVRELVSMAIERISSTGLVVYNATDATGPSDAIAMSGNDPVGAAAKVLDRRNQAEVGGALVQQARALQTGVVADVESWQALELVYERTGVQIADGAQPDARHRARISKRPLRSTGS
jgi:hypothetical protein